MAIQTRVMSTFEAGLVRSEFDYDDSTMRLVAVRCVNDSDQAAWGEAVQEWEPDGQSKKGRKYSSTFAAHTTTEIPIPTTPALKLQCVLDPRGRLDGVSLYGLWPA